MNKECIKKNQVLKLSILKKTEGNPQEMSKKEFQGLVSSIKEKGFILDDPVVWEHKPGEFKIISGHHRIKAAQEAGIKELNCKVLTNLSDKMARLLVLEANKRRGKLNPLNFERYIQDLLTDFEDLSLEEINDDIGAIIEDSISDDIEEIDLQEESNSLKLTITFKSFEEKEKFVDILDYYGNRGRSINDKIKQFVGITLRDQKKKEEKEENISAD